MSDTTVYLLIGGWLIVVAGFIVWQAIRIGNRIEKAFKTWPCKHCGELHGHNPWCITQWKSNEIKEQDEPRR